MVLDSLQYTHKAKSEASVPRKKKRKRHSTNDSPSSSKDTNMKTRCLPSEDSQTSNHHHNKVRSKSFTIPSRKTRNISTNTDNIETEVIIKNSEIFKTSLSNLLQIKEHDKCIQCDEVDIMKFASFNGWQKMDTFDYQAGDGFRIPANTFTRFHGDGVIVNPIFCYPLNTLYTSGKPKKPSYVAITIPSTDDETEIQEKQMTINDVTHHFQNKIKSPCFTEVNNLKNHQHAHHQNYYFQHQVQSPIIDYKETQRCRDLMMKPKLVNNENNFNPYKHCNSEKVRSKKKHRSKIRINRENHAIGRTSYSLEQNRDKQKKISSCDRTISELIAHQTSSQPNSGTDMDELELRRWKTKHFFKNTDSSNEAERKIEPYTKRVEVPSYRGSRKSSAKSIRNSYEIDQQLLPNEKKTYASSSSPKWNDRDTKYQNHNCAATPTPFNESYEPLQTTSNIDIKRNNFRIDCPRRITSHVGIFSDHTTNYKSSSPGSETRRSINLKQPEIVSQNCIVTYTNEMMREQSLQDDERNDRSDSLYSLSEITEEKHIHEQQSQIQQDRRNFLPRQIQSSEFINDEPLDRSSELENQYIDERLSDAKNSSEIKFDYMKTESEVAKSEDYDSAFLTMNNNNNNRRWVPLKKSREIVNKQEGHALVCSDVSSLMNHRLFRRCREMHA